MKMTLMTDDEYKALFLGGLGKKFLNEMVMLNHDRPSFVADNQMMTAYNEGRRSIVLEILNRVAQKEGDNA